MKQYSTGSYISLLFTLLGMKFKLCLFKSMSGFNIIGAQSKKVTVWSGAACADIWLFYVLNK